MRSPLNSLTFYDPSTRTWRGTLVPPLYNPQQSLGRVILQALDKYPEKIAQIHAESDTKLTYGEMKLRTVRMAQNLSLLGYGKGDTLTLVAANSEHVVPLVYACLTLGIVINPLEVTLPRVGLAHMMKTVKPSVVFCEQSSLGEVEAAIDMIGSKVKVFVIGERVKGYKHVEDLLVETGEEAQFVPAEIEDATKHVAVILTTSGSTGPSKAVCLTHAVCIAHMIVPEHLKTVINHPQARQTDLSSVKRCLSGGAHVSVELKRNTEQLISGVDFMIAYGYTELAGVIALSDKGYYKEGCTGVLYPYCQGKIVDDLGRTLDTGEAGELLIKTAYTFLRYENNKKATDETLDAEGWLHTGDIGRFDEDGFLFLIDRKKDIIRYNGHIISPNEIENVIQSVPGVLVVCVAAIAVNGQDVPAAFVLKSEGSHLDEKHIEQAVEQKLPSHCQLRGGVHFVEHIPFTMTGKKHRVGMLELLQQQKSESRQ
ncbi:luciferin 4-monooxygenase-like [Uranotaenia lowii]|uniref:luciferin 4-monooxygenase-like n=1 Tax=Uranotaenia lowii TaxID=190385 RepID=UPI00247B2B12|nr:luciferin 4-monooxygenase-like [Uranotaenia lowii]